MANAVVAAVNTMIRAINSISFTVPDWVPGVGGNYVGFNIPELSKLSIPKLATGAVIPANREFLAVLGDQKHGTNIEAPLDTIMQANEQLLTKAMMQFGMMGGSMTGTPQTVKVQVLLDRKVIGESTVDWGKIQQMSTGNNPFLLGNT